MKPRIVSVALGILLFGFALSCDLLPPGPPDSSELLWTVEGADASGLGSELFLDGGVALFSTAAGGYVGRDAETGAPLWDTGVLPPAFASADRVFFRDGRLLALAANAVDDDAVDLLSWDSATGTATRVQIASTRYPLGTTLARIGSRLYWLADDWRTNDEGFQSYDLATGELRHTALAGDFLGYEAELGLFVFNRNSTLVFAPADGTAAWSWPLSSDVDFQIPAAPCLGTGMTLTVFGAGADRYTLIGDWFAFDVFGLYDGVLKGIGDTSHAAWGASTAPFMRLESFTYRADAERIFEFIELGEAATQEDALSGVTYHTIHRVAAFDAATGASLWSGELPETPFLILQSTTRLYAVSDDRLFRFSKSTGGREELLRFAESENATNLLLARDGARAIMMQRRDAGTGASTAESTIVCLDLGG